MTFCEVRLLLLTVSQECKERDCIKVDSNKRI